MFLVKKYLTVLFLIATVSVNLSCKSQKRILEKGEISLKLGDYTMAIQFFGAVLNDEPENFEARFGMGKALIQKASNTGNDSLIWKQALTHLEAARSLRPSENIEPLLSEAWVIHSRMRLQDNDTIEALKSLARSIDLNPRAIESLNLAGIIYYKMGDSEKAEILFTSVVSEDSSKAFALFNLGMIKWVKNDYQMAYNYWLKAVKLTPKDKDIVYWFTVADKKLRELSR